jgi:hypothetical protein
MCFATYRNAIRVFLADALGLGLALLESVLILKLAAIGVSYLLIRAYRDKGVTRGTYLRILTVVYEEKRRWLWIVR